MFESNDKIITLIPNRVVKIDIRDIKNIIVEFADAATLSILHNNNCNH